MEHLVSSFKDHLGSRGVHIYSEEECRFLPWDEVISFVNHLSHDTDPDFSEKLVDTLSNYHPDREFLAVHQVDDTISIELYARQLEN